MEGEIVADGFELLTAGRNFVVTLGDGRAVGDLIFFRAANKSEGALVGIFDDVEKFKGLAVAEVVLVEEVLGSVEFLRESEEEFLAVVGIEEVFF